MQYNFTKEGYDALTNILFGENPEILKDEEKVEKAAQVVVDNLLRVIGDPETEYKIRNLAEYHEIGCMSMIQHLIFKEYMDAENAGVVPLDPWHRNPNPEGVLENDISIWDSFADLLYRLNIDHEVELGGDEGESWRKILLSEKDTPVYKDRNPVTAVYLTKRYDWNEDIQAFDPNLGSKLDIAIETRHNDLHKTYVVSQIKTDEQLFSEVFGETPEEFLHFIEVCTSLPKV